MQGVMRAGIGVALGLAVASWLTPAVAQTYSVPGTTTTQIGTATLSVGGGLATLDLPDIRFGTLVGPNNNTLHKYPNSKDFGSDVGGAFSGNLVVPWNSTSAVAVSGFWTNFDQHNALSCKPGVDETCGFSNLLGGSPSIGQTLAERAKRNVTNWGTEVEGRYYLHGSPSFGFIDPTFLALGGDVRQIDQNTRINFATRINPTFAFYREGLDTTYSGGYLAVGGNYSLPFFSGLTSSLGLRSSFKGYVGLYNADTSYHGKFYSDGINSLNLSKNNATVIAGLTLQTTKQVTPRTSLSLVSSYDFYSWVPDMKYSDPGSGVAKTHITGDSAFATRTELRLNIGLGPKGLYYK